MNEYSTALDRADFFQTVHAWPLSDELNYDGWLKNFNEGEEREIASKILSFFTFYSSQMVDQLFETAVSNAGYVFSNKFSDWDHSHFKTRCFYSFIPGETLNPTDSGHLFLRKVREKLRIPETQIIAYDKLWEKLQSETSPRPVIFVDDFVGSGHQVRKAWIENDDGYGQTLKDIVLKGDHCAIYSPLIVNFMGYDHIKTYCPDLTLCQAHVIGPEYNLFNKECICWDGNEELFRKGVDLILQKSKLLNIPSTGGADCRDEKGYRKQGLALAFAHGAPDAIPAIFYWSDNWTPLIPKSYER